MSLRGPVPLSGDSHVSTGSTPGVGVLKVTEGGRSATFDAVARASHVVDGVEIADVHAMIVRRVK
jgi:hypothetical protein